MALFNKKKTQTPAASAPPTAPAPSANAGEDFSDFSLEALDNAADDAAVASGKKGRKKAAAKEKKTSSGRALKPGVSIGLNIGSDSIKAVELRAKGSELAITGMGMVPTPADSISNGVVMNSSSLAMGIRDVLAQAGIKSKRVVTSVSGTGALVVRIIEVPKMSDGELADNMKMDADRYIPFPPSEVVMDFTALRELPSDPDAANMEVLLAAAQREVIDLHVQVLQDAKLDPRSIDVEPLAAARILTHPSVTNVAALNGGAANGNGAGMDTEVDYSDVAAILNIGATGTEISILRGDILVFTRTVPTAGNTLTQSLVDTLGLAWSDAEQLKREMGDALPPGDTASGSTPAASLGGMESLDWTEETPGDDADQWNDFASDPNLEADDTSAMETPAAFSDETFADETFTDQTGTDEMPAAPVIGNQASDPFADDFYEQGPSGQSSDDVKNAEPGEQHQQKEPGGLDSPFSFGDDNSAEDAKEKELPTYEAAVTGTEDIAGNGSTPEADEAALLPSTATPQTTTPQTQNSAPAPSSAEKAAGSTPGASDAAPSSFFDFGHAEEPQDKLPTLQQGRPTSFADLLPADEDDFSSLPTLREEAGAPGSIASAFDFPVEAASVKSATPAAGSTPAASKSAADFNDFNLPTSAGAPATTEGIAGATGLDAPEESLLPSQTQAQSQAASADAFSFSFDDAPTEEETSAPTPAITEAAPSPIAVDPFAEFMASAEADAPPATASVAPANAAAAASTPPAAAADNLDLDALFGGSTETAESGGATEVAADDLDFIGLDMSGDDFAMDDAAFGAGLAGASAGEIDAKTLHGVIEPVLETLVNEVRRSLEYHTTRYPDAAVRRVILVGGGAKLRNLDVFFTQKLGLPATIGNPAARLAMRAPNLPAGYADVNGTLFTVALGLAMRELTR